MRLLPRSEDCPALVGPYNPSPNTSMPWNYLILAPRMGMLARVPEIDDDIVFSRQGLNYITGT